MLLMFTSIQKWYIKKSLQGPSPRSDPGIKLNTYYMQGYLGQDFHNGTLQRDDKKEQELISTQDKLIQGMRQVSMSFIPFISPILSKSFQVQQTWQLSKQTNPKLHQRVPVLDQFQEATENSSLKCSCRLCKSYISGLGYIYLFFPLFSFLVVFFILHVLMCRCVYACASGYV